MIEIYFTHGQPTVVVRAQRSVVRPVIRHITELDGGIASSNCK